MSIQYPYNNHYQTPQIPNYLTAQNQFDINTNNAPVYDNRQDCLPERPPRRSPEGFRWVPIYSHFYWDGHQWNSVKVKKPYWGLIDEEHPCDPHSPY
ncbi:MULTISPECIES: hypothetical protein [Bacillus cereus group]|uniref:hypothetical protein n=1 Tax=Bacillus cereus group TaxID=86661 RepID=UPI000D030013|nr:MULTISPECIES: hypothetical protein [Bacillus cereus group]MCU4804851.1 hypothetical protein [Bacillus cereus]MCU5086791.1 hypothetical protein [Bacillus cereus]MCU5142007.1 hypothetical protein [Bacillus cereus]PRT25970.1 hypothetical protein C6351_24720 [Bacillus thuringiensis]TKH75682.1 hypothetical protein FC686_19565 [Bacillus cereus]